MIKNYKRPIFFYSYAMVLSWIFWLIAAYLSHLDIQTDIIKTVQAVCGILGLIAPIGVVAYLSYQDKEIYQDIKSRLFRFNNFPKKYTFYAFFLILISMILAQSISILFGHGLNQFVISGSPSFESAILPVWFILLFAPIAEELAWHSYGTDTLLQKFNLFWTSIIFAFYWTIWHIPLGLIKGYYHSNVIAEGWIYGLNFIISLFVFVLLMNWLYIKSNRSIVLIIIFHLSANISNEIFATHPDSKVIQTVLLLIVTIVVLMKDKSLFFSKTALHNKYKEVNNYV